MAIVSMLYGAGGASSADEVSCTDALGNTSDVQTELDNSWDWSDSHDVLIGTCNGKKVYRGIARSTQTTTVTTANTYWIPLNNEHPVDVICLASGVFVDTNDSQCVIPYALQNFGLSCYLSDWNTSTSQHDGNYSAVLCVSYGTTSVTVKGACLTYIYISTEDA